DPQAPFAEHIPDSLPVTGEPADLPTAIPEFTWPTAVLSGERDLRTPRPIAEQVVELIPRAVLVPLPELGHSALDTHQLVSLHTAHAVALDRVERLPDLTARLAALPRRGLSAKVEPLITTGLRLDLALPSPHCIVDPHRSGRKHELTAAQRGTWPTRVTVVRGGCRARIRPHVGL